MAEGEIMNYQEALTFIHGRPRLKKTPTLARMRELMARLGDPQKTLKIIHITGTNGKGSTSAYVARMLQACGYKVGLFTSPYIVRYNDRFTINQAPILDVDLAAITGKVAAQVKVMDQLGKSPTEFEITTAIMFIYFAQQNVDYAVVEVGIGGTYDSTNIIDQPVMAVITTVALDHMRILGNTLEAIAEQKAGIIKAQCPVVVGHLPAAALAVVTKRAQQLEAPLSIYGRDFSAQITTPLHTWGERFTLNPNLGDVTTWNIQLAGAYQVTNAAIALQVMRILRQSEVAWSGQDLYTGLQATTWPGRFEKVHDQPVVVLDGAHNQAAMHEIKKLLVTKFPGRKVHVLVAILADKQPLKVLEELLAIPDIEITVTSFAGPRPLANLQVIKDHIPQVHVEPVWQTALQSLFARLGGNDILLVTGSLYFIADVRKKFIHGESNGD